MGTYQIRYAIYPHVGSLNPDTIRAAHKFNYNAVYSVPSEITFRINDFITIYGTENIFYQTLKEMKMILKWTFLFFRKEIK